MILLLIFYWGRRGDVVCFALHVAKQRYMLCVTCAKARCYVSKFHEPRALSYPYPLLILCLSIGEVPMRFR